MLYVYILFLTVGVAYSAVSAIFGSHGFDHGSLDHGSLDHGGADVNHSADVPSPFNPLVIASAIATFGGIGLIGKLGFRMSDLTSAIVAVGLAGIIGAIMFFGVVKLMYSSQSDSSFSLADLPGMEAEVFTPIPADGMGEITYTINGMRCSLPATSYNGENIAKGVIVSIKEIASGIASVSSKISIEQYNYQEEMTKDKRLENN